MSASTVLILTVLGIAVAVFLGFKFNHNVGLWCFIFAYLIGCFGLNLKPSALVKFWPLTFTFIIMSVSVFYGYASNNGALVLLAKKILYACRNATFILPWVIFFISFFLSLAGTGAVATTAIVAPISFAICMEAGISPLLAIASVMLPSPPGSLCPWGTGGALPRSNFEATQWAEYSYDLIWPIWINGTICAIILYAIVYIVFKGYKSKTLNMEKPPEFSKDQKKVLILCAIVAIIVIVPALLKLIFKINPKWFAYLDIQFVALTAAMVCKLMKLGDEKKIIKDNVPWSIIFMVTGVTLLMNVAAEGGALDLVASFLSNNLPKSAIAPALVGVAGFMSFFSGGMTVVSPMLLPLVEPLYMATGISPIVTTGAICFGANTTGMSPFSTGGSITLGFFPKEEERSKLFIRQFIMTIACWIMLVLLSFLGLYGLFTFGFEF